MKLKNDIRIISTLLFISLGLLIASCSKDDDNDPIMDVNGTVSIEANGAVSGEIVVTTENTDWTVDVINGNEWLTAYKNGNKVTLLTKENLSTEDRIGMMVISATADSKLSYTVNVTQKGAVPSITVNGADSTDITFIGVFDNKNGIDFKQTVRIVSNVNWNISGKPEWLNISPSNGNGNVEMIIYPISENETASSRTASIILNGDGTSATISVTQEAGKPVCYVEMQNEVALYNSIAWECKAVGDINVFQYMLLSEAEYNRLTDKELIEKISEEEKLKFVDGYIFAAAYDYYGVEISSNTTYYFVSLANDKNGKVGELRKKKLVTPEYRNPTDDAWVEFNKIEANNLGFWFDTVKRGYCDTYHIIYGTVPVDNRFNSVLYAFEINYYLKYNKRHWYAEKWNLKIETDYPNNHTFVYETSELYKKPLCVAYAWGVFRDGTLSSDLVGFQWNVNKSNTIQKVSPNSEKMENIIIKRFEEENM